MESKKYMIEGKAYFQQKLVLGQMRQLLGLMKEAGLLQGNEILIPMKISTKDLIDFLAGKGQMLAKWIAIILRQDGIPLKDKDLDGLTAEIDFSIEPEITMEVVRDFFDFLDLNSLSAKLNAMMAEIEKRMMEQIGSKKPVSSSQEEISPSETISSGDLLSKNANPS